MSEEKLLQKIEKAARDGVTMLSLSHNQLATLPPEIAKLTKLTTRYLSYNQLAALPPEIGELTKLTTLDLSDNQLTALPHEIGELTRLTTLDLRGNPLPIPSEILEKTGEPATIINFPEGHSEEVNVKELPNGIESEEERRGRREEGDLKKRGSAPRPTPPPQLITSDNTSASKPANPWISGSFYLVAAVVLMTVLAVISMNVPWYVLPVVIIGGILSITVIGALQLRQDKKLSETNFLTLMSEAFKQLFRLKR